MSYRHFHIKSSISEDIFISKITEENMFSNSTVNRLNDSLLIQNLSINLKIINRNSFWDIIIETKEIEEYSFITKILIKLLHLFVFVSTFLWLIVDFKSLSLYPKSILILFVSVYTISMILVVLYNTIKLNNNNRDKKNIYRYETLIRKVITQSI